MTDDYSPTEWTRHITVDKADSALSTPTVDAVVEVEVTIAVGDTVEVRHSDNTRSHCHIVPRGQEQHSGDMGADLPIAGALIGKCMEDEFELHADGKVRFAVVERTLKAA